MLTPLGVLLVFFSVVTVLCLGFAFIIHLFETLSGKYFVASLVCFIIFLACFGFLTLYANHLYKLWTVAC